MPGTGVTWPTDWTPVDRTAVDDLQRYADEIDATTRALLGPGLQVRWWWGLLFIAWHYDEVEIGRRFQSPAEKLEPLTYPKSERHPGRFVRLYPDCWEHIVTGERHHDIHFRRRPEQSSGAKEKMRTQARGLERFSPEARHCLKRLGEVWLRASKPADMNAKEAFRALELQFPGEPMPELKERTRQKYWSMVRRGMI